MTRCTGYNISLDKTILFTKKQTKSIDFWSQPYSVILHLKIVGTEIF